MMPGRIVGAIALALGSVAVTGAAAQSGPDWPSLQRYRQANADLPPPAPDERRVVFMGNSITEAWAPRFPELFPGKPYVGRGISGQTTPQMLVRFRQDVIALAPAVVVILAGTNDIAGNTGPSTIEMIEDNLASMAELAQANGIRVVLCSVLPVFDYPWRPGLEPAPKIVALNAWIRSYAASHGAAYADFHGAMADARQGLPNTLAADGVHPNDAGFRIMAPLVERAIAEVLATPARAEAVDLVALTRARIAADFAADRAALDSLLSDHVSYGRSSGVLDDKKVVLAEVGPGGPYSLDYLTGDSLTARRYGTTGVVNGIMNIKLKAQATPYRIRFTDVWALESGRWRLVSFQATRLPK